MVFAVSTETPDHWGWMTSPTFHSDICRKGKNSLTGHTCVALLTIPQSHLKPYSSAAGSATVTGVSAPAENGSRHLRFASYDPPALCDEGGRSCTATTILRHPFEPSGKRRRGFPLASPTSSAATGSSASTPNSSKSSAGTTCARAARVAAFRRCCRRTGRFDGVQADYYVRDQ